MDTPLFLGYATAAYVLLHRGLAGLRKSHALPTPGAAPTARRVNEARELLELPPGIRLDTVVTCDRDKRQGAGQKAHKYRYASTGDYLSLGNNVYASSPQLAFMQCAEVLSPQELVLLGLELCGSFVSHDGEFVRPKPLCTRDTLEAYVGSRSGERGANKAREALRFIADDSASPRESQLTALLCMPQKWGGYGFQLPTLNARIDLTPEQRRILGKSHLRCDLLWEEAAFAIEYDSDAFHTGIEKISSDSLRRNILRTMGITVADLTNSQLKSAEALHEVAIQIDHCLGSGLLAKRKSNWNTLNRELRHLALVQNASDRLL